MSNYENIIKNNAKEYYETGKQKLSDDVFDAVVDKLKQENPDSEILTTGWGYKPDDETKVKHKYCHVGSLDKLKTYDDISKFFKCALPTNIMVFHVSAKLDGMSVVLYYQNGKLDKALTRGDGEYGIDITNKVLHIDGIETELKDNKFTGAIRGEIFMTPTNFNKYREEHPEAKNHRNSAIGIINSDDVAEDYKYLSLYVYTIMYGLTFISIDTYYEWLEDNFKNIVPYCYTSLKTDYYNRLQNIRDKFSEIVNIDGLVLTYIIFNRESNEFVYTQAAFKFQDEIKITNVTHLEWTMSKHGAYIPVVCIEPIELEGTTVQRVTGYNAKWIVDRGIKTGSIVAVRKANQIIPEIVDILE